MNLNHELQELEEEYADYKKVYQDSITEVENAKAWNMKTYQWMLRAQVELENYKKEHGLLEDTAFTS